MEDRLLTDGSRIVYSPLLDKYKTTSSILSCILKPDEEVEWHYVHIQNESYISGYTIHKKKKL